MKLMMVHLSIYNGSIKTAVKKTRTSLGGEWCYTLTLATAYRMLFGRSPHALNLE